MHEAKFWEVSGERIACRLCPHSCQIGVGKVGRCRVRKNDGGRLVAMTYGLVSSMHLDPMEKKPLYHFHPGEPVLSFGSVGCNLGCLHCQNFSISQARPDDFPLQRIEPQTVPELVQDHACNGVAWTYNEPTMWYEFASEASKLCKDRGMFTVFVSNGYIQEAPLRELRGVIDAINIDVKGFTEEFYKHVCKASLQPVLEAVTVAREIDMHVELTYLIIPGQNDDLTQLQGFSRWVASLDAEMPVHFSRFHPDYLMNDVPSTPAETMDLALRTAKEAGLNFVYLGNMRSEAENTFCPSCGTLAISRSGFRARLINVKDGHCGKCGRSLNLII